MRKEFISKAHTLSLLHNGNFSAGLGHWFGSYLRHKQTQQPFGESTTPAYAATAAISDSVHFPDGVPPGLNQFIDHPALFSYPSRRVANRVEMFVVDETRALLRLLPESTVDGAPVEPPFQHPFLFSDASGHVPVRPGSDVLLVNYDKIAYTTTYKAGGVLQNFGALPIVGGLSYHVLEIGSSKTTFLSSVDIKIDLKTVVTVTTVASSTKQLSFFGDFPAFTQASRQLDSSAVGVLPGDSLVLDTTKGTYYAVVYAITASGLQIQPVSAQGQLMLPYLPDNATIKRIRVFSTTVARVSVEKPVFRYEYTLAYSRDAGDTFVLPEPRMQFRTATYDEAADEYSFTGIGDSGVVVPRVPRDSQVLTRAATGGGSWERVIEHFFLESREPIVGRLLFTIGAPNVIYSNARNRVLSIRYIANAAPHGPVFVLTVEGSVDYAAGDQIELFDSVNTLAPDFWFNQVLKERTLYVLSAQGSTITVRNPTTSTAAELTALLGGANVLYTLNMTTHTTAATQILDSGVFSVSDIFLTKDDYSQGLFRYDDPPEGVTQRPLLDPLLANADLLDNALPSGVTVLYAGGGTCPPGYKRLDGINTSEVAGIPGYYELPDPVSKEYLSERNRTVITWDSTPLAAQVSSENASLSTLSVTRDVPLALLGNPIEKVTIFPDIPAIQPGMLLGNRPIDQVAAVRAADVTNPVLALGDRPSAVTLIPPAGQPVLNAPYIELNSIGNAYEMWFKLISLGGATSAEQVLLQRMSFPNGISIGGSGISGGIRGWEVFLENNIAAGAEARVVLRVYTGGLRASGPTHTWDSYTGSVPRSLTQADLGKWLFLFVHFSQNANNTVVRLAIYETNNSSPIIQTTQTFSNLLLSDFIYFTSPVSRITAGRGNSGVSIGSAVNTLDSGASVAVDLLRVFANPTVGAELYLYNNGYGRSVVDESITSTVNAALLLNEGQGTVLQNTALTPPQGYAGNGSLILGPGQIPVWDTGYIRSLNTAGSYSSVDYSAPYEDKVSQYLITDLAIEVGDQTRTKLLPSAEPAGQAARGMFGAGFGVISYPYIVSENDYQNGAIADENFRYAFSDRPLGPIGANVVGKQDAVFQYPGTNAGQMTVRLVKLLNNLHVLVDVGEVLRKTDFFSSALVQTTEYLSSDTADIGKAFVDDVKVGDVYYLNWRHDDGDRYGEFFAEVISVKPKTVNGKLTAEVVFGRYDRRPLVFNCNVNTFLSRSTSYLRPAKLFGVGQQRRASATTFDLPGITMQQLTVTTGNGVEKIWSVRVADYSISATVYGDATNVSGKLIVEPSGYLRFGDPATLLDYGTSGHSHIVDKKDTNIRVENLLPVIKFGAGSYNTVPFTPVASDHDHGYLDKYRWPLPPFRLLTVCTKL